MNNSNSKPNLRRPDDWYSAWGKRIFDLVVSAIALPALGIVVVITSLFVAWRLGRPVFFRQQRPGKDGELFWMVKFRSMTDERDDEGNLTGQKTCQQRSFGHFDTVVDEPLYEPLAGAG